MGYTIPNAESLPIAAQEICTICAKVEVVYPPFDHQATEEARTAFLRGEVHYR